MKISGMMKKKVSFLILFVYVLSAGCRQGKHTDKFTSKREEDIVTFLQDSSLMKNLALYNTDVIKKLYKQDGEKIASKWNTRERVDQMISAINKASSDGLNPDDYHLLDIKYLEEKITLSTMPDEKDVVKLELLLTDSFLTLAYHLSVGKTDPETIYPEWDVSRRNTGMIWNKLIDSVLLTNNLINAVQAFSPRHQDYDNLKKSLSQYLFLEEHGGWSSFDTKLPRLKKGMRHPDIVLLRKRLEITQGHLNISPGNEDLFDGPLEEQVKSFQLLHNLDPDGVAGKETINTLNIPVKDCIDIIKGNLERWRWISDELGKRYIRVNIAGFDLAVIENDKQVFQSQAIVGEYYKQTPVFSANLQYLVLNPEWIIPPDILKNEIIPEIKQDTGYLKRNNMDVIRTDGTVVDKSAINWNLVDPDNFPYMIRQVSGPENSLGSIEFSFPNKYYVYIHDTPYKNLFQESSRAFSHGCIRINKAFKLAQYLLKNEAQWDSVAISRKIEEGEKFIINLKSPLPVHILYLTAWADNDGTTYFGKDIYNRDLELIDALKQSPPEKATH
jgi:L,D-transpeptidase YcbB